MTIKAASRLSGALGALAGSGVFYLLQSAEFSRWAQVLVGVAVGAMVGWGLGAILNGTADRSNE